MRAAGERIAPGGMECRLKWAIPRGDVIVYGATAREAGPWMDVVIRELYPRIEGVSRAPDGSLQVAASARAAMERAGAVLARGQQVEEAWLRRCGGVSRLWEAYGTRYVMRAFPRAASLQAVLEQGELPVDAALQLMDQLLEAVEALHRQGLLHLEITPELLYLLPGGQLFLDHRCLWERERPGDMGEAVGFLPYAAPEVRLHNLREVGVAADVYSCCAVLFALLLGRPVREAEVLGRGLAHTLGGAFSALGLPASTAAELMQILCRGLHTLPHRRYASASALRQALRKAAPPGGVGPMLPALHRLCMEG